MKKSTNYLLLSAIIVGFLMVQCGQPSTPAEEVGVNEEVKTDPDKWVVDEHQINDIVLTSAAPSLSREPVATAPTSDEEEDETYEVEIDEETDIIETDAVVTDGTNVIIEAEYDVYDIVSVQDQMGETDYVQLVSSVSVEEAIIPLEETQTITSYGKKGETQAVFQVVTDPDGNIEHIIFTDKKHTDAYNVSAGMSGKEVKKLRKELKHMEKNGQYFLYDDQSNVMYLMTVKDNITGEEVTTPEIDTMEVSAIVWKDKNHKDRKNNSM